MAVPEKYRTGWRLLGRDDAPLMPHRQAAVQSLQDFHSRSGIAGTFPPWQQLQGMQLESHRVVPGNFSAVLEAQDLFQTLLRVQGPECRLRVLRWNTETPVESRQELLQHAVGFPDAARPCQPKFGYEARLTMKEAHGPRYRSQTFHTIDAAKQAAEKLMTDLTREALETAV